MELRGPLLIKKKNLFEIFFEKNVCCLYTLNDICRILHLFLNNGYGQNKYDFP